LCHTFVVWVGLFPNYKSCDNNMPKESHKWLPKFIGNNVITAEEHLDAIGVAMEDNGIKHEDVDEVTSFLS
jgi:hypothetical protein